MDGLVKQHDWIDQRVFDLYDEYCHGRIDRPAMPAQREQHAHNGGQHEETQRAEDQGQQLIARGGDVQGSGNSGGQQRDRSQQTADEQRRVAVQALVGRRRHSRQAMALALLRLAISVSL